MAKKDLKLLLQKASVGLNSPKSTDIFNLRYGLYDNDSSGLTLECVGRKYGVSRERVRQITDRTIKRIILKAQKAKKDDETSDSCLALINACHEIAEDIENSVDRDFFIPQ